LHSTHLQVLGVWCGEGVVQRLQPPLLLIPLEHGEVHHPQQRVLPLLRHEMNRQEGSNGGRGTGELLPWVARIPSHDRLGAYQGTPPQSHAAQHTIHVPQKKRAEQCNRAPTLIRDQVQAAGQVLAHTCNRISINKSSNNAGPVS